MEAAMQDVKGEGNNGRKARDNNAPAITMICVAKQRCPPNGDHAEWPSTATSRQRGEWGAVRQVTAHVRGRCKSRHGLPLWAS
jgi:hypothetical protein